MEKELGTLVNNIYLGIDIDGSIEKLKVSGTVALNILLGLSDFELKYPKLPNTRHPRDAYDDLQSAIFRIAQEHHDYFLELLYKSMEQNNDCLFTLTWLAGPLNLHKGIDALIKGLKHKNKYIRWSCCTSLLYFHNDKVTEALISALRDRASMVRSTALDGILKYPDRMALPNLKWLLNEKSPGIRNDAKKAIEIIEKRY